MIFHENRLLADDSHVISFLFCQKLGKMSQNLSSAAVVIGALRFKIHKHTQLRPNKKLSVFRVLGLKMLGREGTNIFLITFFLEKI